MSNVRYKGEVNRGPSVALWGDLSKLEDDKNAGKCQYSFEDFTGWSTHTVNTNANIIGSTGAWKVQADAGVLVNPVANSVDLANGEHGVLVIQDADADNDEAYLSRVVDCFRFDLTYGYKLFYEARIKVETVNTGIALLLGFALNSTIAAGMLADDTTGIVSTASVVGFHVPDATGTAIQTIFQKASQTKQVVSATAGTLVSNTWIKLGLLYDPFTGSGKALRYFIDGIELPDYGTAAQVAAATFPDDVNVTPFFGFKIDGTANLDGFVDWIIAAQYLS